MKSKSQFSLVVIIAATTLLVLMPFKARALYDLYACCETDLLACAPGCTDQADCPWTCWDEYMQCEHLGPYAGGGPNPDCGAFTHYRLSGIILNHTANAQNFTISIQPTSYAFSTNLAGVLNSVYLYVGDWNGTNSVGTTTATAVDFYAVPLSVVSAYTASNKLGALPWMFVGSGTQDKAGYWGMHWTPPSNEAYVVDADTYDPTLTNLFINNEGIVTNGGSSSLGLVLPTPATPELITPTALPDGSFMLRVIGPPAAAFTLQSSADLKNWTNEPTVTNFNGLAQVVEGPSSTSSYRFYRASFAPLPAPPSYQGLVNLPVGNASISVSDNSLYITNLGSSGQDGFAIALPPNLTSLEVEHQDLDPDDTLPIGAYLQQNTFGTGGPVTNGLLGSLTVTKVGTANYSIAADFSPIGASTYTVRGYLDGAMVMNLPNQSGPVVGNTTNAGFSDDSEIENPGLPGYYPPVVADTLDWITPPNHSNPNTFTPSGSAQAYTIDHLYIIPEYVTFPTVPSTIQLVASQIPALTITSENASLLYQGLANTSLGNAAISASGDSLYITNLSSSGQDGVSIAAPADLTGFDVQVQELDPSNSLPVGAFVKQTLIGTFNGIPNTTLGTVTTTKTGATNVSVAADFSAIGASTYSVQSYYQGTLTAQASNQTGAAVEIAGGPCTNCYRDPFGTTYLYSTNSGQFLGEDWGFPVFASFSGSAFTSMDYLYISPENVTNTVTVTAMQLTASQMPALTITSETQSLVYQGVVNTTVGNAAVSVSGNSLYITNLGSSGQDGLTISFPPSFVGMTLGWQPLVAGGSISVGGYITEQAIGTLNGVANSVLGTVTMTKTSTTNFSFTADFSPLGVSSNTVLAFRQGQLVGQGTAPNRTVIANEIDPSGGGSGGGDFWISPCTSGIISPNYGKPCPYDYLISVPMDDLPCGIAGATSYLTVDDLQFGDATQSTMQFTISALKITASHVPYFVITNENTTLAYQGLPNTSLGNAAISASGNNLYITNLGSGGQDGVSIAMPTNFSSYSVSWQELDPSGTLPIGAYLREKGIGNALGITNGVVFSTTSTKIGSGQYAVTASFNNSNVIDVAVYSAGSLVTTVTGLSGNLCVASDGGYDVDDTIKNQPKKTYPPNTTFAFNGLGSVQGDTLVLIPETSPQISSISSIQLLASGIPSIDIIDELAYGPFTQLQVLLPGETNAPYTVTGKTGTPAPLTGGQVTCTVLAVDSNWNPVPTVADTINITCSDPNSITPSPAPLVNGSGQFTVFFTDDGASVIDTITALDVSNTGIAPGTSSQFNP